MDPARVIKSAQQRWSAGDRAGAVAEAMRIVARFPYHAAANELLAAALAEQGRWEQAVARLDIAIRAQPHNPQLHFALACARGHMGDVAGAAAGFTAALNAAPDFDAAVVPLGLALLELGRSSEAETVLRRGLSRQPDHIDAAAALGAVLADRARTADALALLKRTLEFHPGDHDVLSITRQWLNYLDTTGDGEAAALRERHGRALGPAPAWAWTGAPGERDPERPLRIGYLSPDLRRHSVSYFFEPLLSAHDRSRFHTFCYATDRRNDETTRRLRAAAGTWRECWMLDDHALAAMIRQDRIDILIELSGLTTGNRLAMLSRRCAPVQVTFIGCPSSTGIAAIDGRLVDDITDPPGSECHASEKLVRIPGCFLCYRPPDEAPPPPARPDLAGRPITFGSFNSLAKLSPATARLWARVMEAVPGSLLLLKGKALGDETARASVRAVLTEAGIQESRVRLLGDIPDLREHLAAYTLVDIALDPIVYNGTTTTCEALWMGTPVISLLGNLHAGRVGASLLTAAGHPEWIARTPDEYIAIAAALASDPGGLAAIHAGLREQVRTSRLCDAGAHARAVEACLSALWRERLSRP